VFCNKPCLLQKESLVWIVTSLACYNPVFLVLSFTFEEINAMVYYAIGG
jgi:hypothetical protein